MDEATNGIVIGSVGGDLSLQAGGDIVAGNKTIINTIIQRITRELATTPYKFLASYDIADRDIFYGRDAVIEELAAQVGRHKVILINGASGAGKSSLVNAGLIPRVADNGYTFVAFREYSNLLAQMQAYFEQKPEAAASPSATTNPGSLLRLISTSGVLPIVIVLDQFERFFVRVAEDERHSFIAAFSHCLRNSQAQDLCFVLGVRRDFLGQLVSEFEEQIPDFLNAAYRINLLPLNKNEAREAILRPIADTSLKIQYDEAFVDSVMITGLAEQTGGGVSINPPHLQIVCNQLFEAARQRLQTRSSALINRELYDELGGAETILNTYLDKVVEDVAQDPERIAIVHSILKTMIDAGSNTRAFVALDGFKRALPDVNEAEILRFIEKLLDRRVIEERKPAFSLSHEHMVGKVKEWFDPRELERKRAAETLGRGMMEWKNSAALLNRRQVEGIRTWIPELTNEEQELLRASEQRYQEEERKEAARKRLKTLSFCGAAVFILLIMALGAFSWFQKLEADEQRNAAVAARDQAQRDRSKVVAALIETETETGSPALAVRVALAALPRTLAQPDAPYVPEVAVALYHALERSRELRRFIGHEGPILRSHLSPDGAKLVTSSEDHTARVWEVATGRELAVFRGHRQWVDTAQFSPDSTRVITTAGDVFTVSGEPPKIWDTATGRELLTLGEEASSAPPAFSPDGAKVVTGSLEGKTARLWDAATGKQLAVLEGHEDMIAFVAFSPDGRKIITGSVDHTARLWDAATGKQLAVLEGHEDDVLFAAFSPDGSKVVTTAYSLFGRSADRRARLWDATTGRQTGVLEGHAEGVTVAAFSPDSQKLITGSRDRTARLWDASTAKELVALRGHSGWVMTTSFSSDGSKALTASEDGTARVWSMRGDELSILRGHGAGVPRAFFSPAGKSVITSSLDGTARVWDVREMGPSQLVLDFPPMLLGGARLSPDEKRLLTLHLGHVQLWDGESRRMFHSQGHFINDANFSRDGARIVTASTDRTARVWDAASGKELLVLRGHEDKIQSAFFSPEGSKVLTASADRTARLWDAGSGREIVSFQGHQDAVNHAEFSPDGSRMVTVSDDGTARVWDTASGEEIAVFDGHPHKVGSGTFSADGMKVLTTTYEKFGQCDDCAAYLWDAATGRQLVVLKGHKDSVGSAGFSSDGSKIVTTSKDHTVRLWDATSGSPLAVLRGHDRSVVYAVFYSRDGKRDNKILTGSTDGTVRAWRILPTGQELIDLACARVPWPLTEEQRQRFGISEEWCTLEVSAELRARLDLDMAQTADEGGAPAQ